MQVTQLILWFALATAQAVQAQEPIQPLEAPTYNPAKAELGRELFSDARLSHNDQISCASCHSPDQAGVDGLTRSVGVAGTSLARNTPTVFNASLNFTQMWDGRIRDLETRVQKAVVSPKLMGMASWDIAVEKIAAIDAYQSAFARLYGEVNAQAIQNAIAEYQRSLVLVNSPFDRYLRGDKTAISEQAKEGYELFKAYGCVSCHQGANVGGNMFQKMGVLKPIDQKKWNNKDVGRFALTGKPWDKHVFKVPSLRLVVHTAPYFHDGSAKTLKDAVNKMINYQLDRPVPEAHKDAIISFLKTLPGELPATLSNNPRQLVLSTQGAK